MASGHSLDGSGSRPRTTWLCLSATREASRSLKRAPWRSAAELTERGLGLGVLQSLLEVSACAELRGLAGGDLDPLAGLRVHALACATLGDRELAEARDGNVATALQRLLDHFSQGIHGRLRLRPLDVGPVGYLLDQLGLVQV